MARQGTITTTAAEATVEDQDIRGPLVAAPMQAILFFLDGRPEYLEGESDPEDWPIFCNEPIVHRPYDGDFDFIYYILADGRRWVSTMHNESGEVFNP